jgi:hypothetical protein
MEAISGRGLADLSSRTHIYRSKLLDEFNLGEGTETKGAPILSSADLEGGTFGCVLVFEMERELTNHLDVDAFKKLLRETPHQLIKFKLLKRSKDDFLKRQLDRRLLRVGSKNALPLAVWAKWITTRIRISRRFCWRCFDMVSLILNQTLCL